MSRRFIFIMAGFLFASAASAQQTTQLPSFDLNDTDLNDTDLNDTGETAAAPAETTPGVLGGCPDDGTISLECVVNFGKFDQTTQAAVEVTEAAAAVAAQPTAQPVALPQIDIEVQFGYDSFQLTPQAIARLSSLQALLADPSVRDTPILIVGHTDSAGGYDYNQELSRKRAVAVATHVSAITGIPFDRFLPVGMGYEVLKYPDNPRAAGNRRVTIAWATGS